MQMFAANKQWSERPADERFSSLEDLYQQTKQYAETAMERTANIADLRTESYKGDVVLLGRQNAPAQLTHWSFGQLCSRIGAPASYLRQLPSTLTVTNLNHGLKKLGDDREDGAMQLLFHQNGSLLCRALTSEKYSRIWNWEVAERLIGLQATGWEPAKPDTHWGHSEVGVCIMCEGRLKTPIVLDGTPGEHVECKHCNSTGKEYPALYASDHDMFAFVRNRSAVIREPGNPDGLQRGVIVENSEVGASALKLTRFLYREMCGNFLIWGMTKVVETSIRHVGKHVRGKFDLYSAEIKKYAEMSAGEDEAKVLRARTKILGKTKEEVLDLLFGKRIASRKLLDASYGAVIPEQDGDPNSVWGMAQGMTRFSQGTTFADERNQIDRAAGKVLELAEGSF